MRTLRSALAVLLSLTLIALAPGLEGSRAAAAVYHGSAKTARFTPVSNGRVDLRNPGRQGLAGSLALSSSLVPTLKPLSAQDQAVVVKAGLGGSAVSLAVNATPAAGFKAFLKRLSSPLPQFGRMGAGTARTAVERDFLRRVGIRGLTAETEEGFDQDGDQNGGEENSDAESVQEPERKPFVASMVIIDALLLQEQNEPEKAFETAVALVKDSTETRYEVKAAALRLLGRMPAVKVMPTLVSLLELMSAPETVDAAQTASVSQPIVQTTGRWARFASMFRPAQVMPLPAVSYAPDLTWALRRELVRMLGARAPEAGELKDYVVGVLKKSFSTDRNVSVRLMARWALEKYGVEAGAEIDTTTKKPVDHSIFRKKSVEDTIRDSKDMPKPARPVNVSRLLKWFIGILIVAALIFGSMDRGPKDPKGKEPVKTEQADSLKTKHTADSLKRAAFVADSLRLDTTMTPEQSLREIRKDIHRIANGVDDAQKRAKERESEGSGWGSVLSILFIPALIFGMLFLIPAFRRSLNRNPMSRAPKDGGDQGGKSKARFTDVAGIDETLIELQEVVEFLKNPKPFKAIGAKMPKGALLKGPPGTGKTLIAKAVAGEAGVNFFSISGSEFVEMYVGVGAARVRELFAQARAKAPAIIFIDEIDAIGAARGSDGPRSGGDSEREATLNQLLTEIDGFDNSAGVFIIGATNLAAKLDPALVRSGRLDRKILVDLPEAYGREAILQLYGRGVRMGPDADLDFIAKRSSGLSGADMMNLMNEAALLAVRRGSKEVELRDLDEAFDRLTIGQTIHRNMPPALKQRVALHESGHVMANLTSVAPSPQNKVTILPKSDKSLGHAESGSEEGDRHLLTQDQMEARVDMAMGGVVAEELFYDGKWSTGPGGDFESAEKTVRYMVENLGMSSKVGFLQGGGDSRNPYREKLSDAMREVVDQEVQRLLKESHDRVFKRLSDPVNKAKLEKLAQALRERETLTREAIYDIVGKPEGLK